jgi:hypothetical protein
MGLVLVHAFKSVNRSVASHYKLLLYKALLFRRANFSLYDYVVYFLMRAKLALLYCW